MSLGHWCFGLHCHMFTRFWAHWVETCHCAEFRFWTEEASNWSTWRLFEFTERFFTQAITDPDHCPLSSSTTRSLQSTMATVTAATAGRTEQHSAVTDRGLTDFPLGRFNQLVANTLRVPALGYESVSATEMLAPTLPEFEAAEINDTVGHSSCHCCEDSLWDTEKHCTEPRLASFNCRAWKYDWWTVWNSLRNS